MISVQSPHKLISTGARDCSMTIAEKFATGAIDDTQTILRLRRLKLGRIISDKEEMGGIERFVFAED